MDPLDSRRTPTRNRGAPPRRSPLHGRPACYADRRNRFGGASSRSVERELQSTGWRPAQEKPETVLRESPPSLSARSCFRSLILFDVLVHLTSVGFGVFTKRARNRAISWLWAVLSVQRQRSRQSE